ncbi:MAG: hypothetical protein C0621_01535 [Desulfuromonas sp.]|nr:MAG: hypothetical protein C0621_01535 [Desulfuromonas sp.]
MKHPAPYRPGWQWIPLLVLLLLTLGVSQSFATPLAGTTIGNQASATYTDASSISRTSTSNTVTTVVQQIASLTLTTSQTKSISPGSTVYFPHTLTNTGNGSDSFSLSAVDADTGAVTFNSISIYADSDGNGIPDNGTVISSTGALASGTAFKFVVAATVSGTTSTPATETITVTGTSVLTGSVTASNTDTVNATGNAVININKSLSVSSGPSPSSGNILVTLTYSNTGNSTATDVTITDIIGTDDTAGMTYVPSASANPLWSGGGTLDDASDGDDGGIDYSYDGPSKTVTAVIASIAPSVSGTLKFYLTVNGSVAPGSSKTNNRASYSYDDGSGSTISGQYTNYAAYTVLQTASVVANGSSTVSTNGTSEPVSVASANQGAIVSFDNYIWNTGNGTDTFDITLGSSNFPAGTTFQLYKADGVTPLTSTSGTGAPDTGPVAAAASYKVVVKATLPASASGGGAYTVTLTATSVSDTSKSDTVIDQLTTISGNVVDLTNNYVHDDASCNDTGDSCGYGVSTGEASPQTTNTVNPGASTSFTLYVNNTSGVADTYNLFADDDNTWSSPASNDLPSGWTVAFNSGTCASPGGSITNTGVVTVGDNAAVCATITIPAGTAAGDTEIYFRAVSPTTGAVDTKHDRITVNAVRALAVAPDNSGQIFPGGTVVYSHLLTNNGNVVEGDGTVSSIALSLADTLSGWASVVYYDKDDNSTLDTTDPIVSTALHSISGVDNLDDGLGIGEVARFFVKVTAPLGAAIGDINQTTLTATTTNGSYTTSAPAAATSQDTTQVIAGQVRMVKTQALDSDCDGDISDETVTVYSTAQITTGAIPGACLRYKIVATNDGTAAVDLLIISDATPANTVYNCGAGDAIIAAITGSGSENTITAPACGSAGTISATVGTLEPSATSTVTFGVQINP